MSNSDLASMIASFERAVEGRPDSARNLVALAELAAEKKETVRAFELGRRAIAASISDPEAAVRARALLSSLLPGYHVPMMNDGRRNEAWDRALQNAIRPGMHVLEIGTGGGMLALMAARAGAARVTTCERDPVVAALALEIAARNGYADRIRVIPKCSQDIILGADLERRADLLFCDIFSNNLIGFEPFPAIADAMRRLVVPGSPTVPGAVAIRLALAEWGGYPRCCQSDRASGFDISPFSDFATRRRTLQIGDERLVIRSADYEAFRFELTAQDPPASGKIELLPEAVTEGEVNGIVQWIRLELDAGNVLESRPAPGTEFFSAPHFHPLPHPLGMRRGDRLKVMAAYSGKTLTIGATGPQPAC